VYPSGERLFPNSLMAFGTPLPSLAVYWFFHLNTCAVVVTDMCPANGGTSLTVFFRNSYHHSFIR